MSIQYLHPLSKYKEYVQYAQRETESVDTVGLSLADRTIRNIERLFGSKTAKLNNSNRGAYFEIFVYDAILNEIGGDLSRVSVNVLDKDHHAEVDVVVNRCGIQGDMAACVHLKTSIRERWRHPDRDSIVIRENKTAQKTILAGLEPKPEELKFWLVGYKEHLASPPEKAVKHFRNAATRFAGIHALNIGSVYDDVLMSRLSAFITNKSGERG